MTDIQTDGHTAVNYLVIKFRFYFKRQNPKSQIHQFVLIYSFSVYYLRRYRSQLYAIKTGIQKQEQLHVSEWLINLLLIVPADQITPHCIYYKETIIMFRFLQMTFNVV